MEERKIDKVLKELKDLVQKICNTTCDKKGCKGCIVFDELRPIVRGLKEHFE